jgi:hypothetical protein
VKCDRRALSQSGNSRLFVSRDPRQQRILRLVLAAQGVDDRSQFHEAREFVLRIPFRPDFRRGRQWVLDSSHPGIHLTGHVRQCGKRPLPGESAGALIVE